MKTAPRKLLVAAVGVATINYAAACGKENTPVAANLAQPMQVDASELVVPVAGNLPAPPPMEAGPPPPVAGNLPAPPPIDAGTTKPTTKDAGAKK